MLWLSLGENCLPDDLLKRHQKKSFSTPYSPCRSNIDYALHLEQRGYEVLLDKTLLTVADAYGARVVRSLAVVDADPIFESAHRGGFEFTHHDVLTVDSDRQSFRRKIDRLNNLRGKEDVLFLYHHRRTKETDLKAVRAKLMKFTEHYKADGVSCMAALFYQTPVARGEARGLVVSDRNGSLLEYEFRTYDLWGGKDPEVFWARVDDDLVVEMISHAETEFSAVCKPQRGGHGRSR